MYTKDQILFIQDILRKIKHCVSTGNTEFEGFKLNRNAGICYHVQAYNEKKIVPMNALGDAFDALGLDTNYPVETAFTSEHKTASYYHRTTTDMYDINNNFGKRRREILEVLIAYFNQFSYKKIMLAVINSNGAGELISFIYNTETDTNELDDLILEYLRFNGYGDTYIILDNFNHLKSVLTTEL